MVITFVLFGCSVICFAASKLCMRKSVTHPVGNNLVMISQVYYALCVASLILAFLMAFCNAFVFYAMPNVK